MEGRLARQRQWHNKHVFEAALHAGFDVVIIDEAHKLTKDMSGEETARYKVGKAFSEAAPVLLLLTATPHQGDSAKFKNLLNLNEPYLFYRESDGTPENVKKVTMRHNNRAAVDLQGRRIFKQQITSLYLIEREAAENRIELELYDAVTGYVSDFYNLVYQQNDRTMMFLLLIYQRMVSSSSRAIFVSLSQRLESLQARWRQLAGGMDEPRTGRTKSSAWTSWKSWRRRSSWPGWSSMFRAGAIKGRSETWKWRSFTCSGALPWRGGRPWAATTPNL